MVLVSRIFELLHAAFFNDVGVFVLLLVGVNANDVGLAAGGRGWQGSCVLFIGV